MSPKRIIIIIGIIVLVTIGVWVFISARNGSLNEVGTNGTGIGSLFPFFSSGSGGGEDTNTGTNTDGGIGSGGGEATPGVNSPLKRISNKVVAGFTIVLSPNTSPITTLRTAVASRNTSASISTTIEIPKVRFLERGTGYVYDVDATGVGEKKITGTAIVRSLDALFGDNGKAVLVRYIKNDNQTVATFLGRIPEQTEENVLGELKGEFLPDNVLDLAVAPDGKSFLYLLATADGSVGLSMKTDGTAKKQLFTSPFSEWLMDSTTGALTATTKASSNAPGYAYIIQKSGFFQKILGGVQGLTTKMSDDGKNLLYSVTTNSKLGLYVLRLKDGSGVSLGLSTLPEKCVWSKDAVTVYCAVDESVPTGDLPDAWYQGVTHFTDSLWKIDTATGTTKKIIDGSGIDAIKLTLDPTEKYLLFVNKNDGGLWSLDLSPQTVQ